MLQQLPAAANCQPSRQFSAACLASAVANVDRLVDAFDSEALPDGAVDEGLVSSASDADSVEQGAASGTAIPLASLPAGALAALEPAVFMQCDLQG